MKTSSLPAASEHHDRQGHASRAQLDGAPGRPHIFNDSRTETVVQRRLAALAVDSPHTTALRTQSAVIQARAVQDRTAQQTATQDAQHAHAPVQRVMIGAGAAAGHEETLGGVADSLAAASKRVASFISARARDTGAGPAASSALGANHPGNLYVRSNFVDNGSLEAWAEMTGLGGGYIKRVRVTQNGAVTLDRVMGGARTAFHDALALDRHPGAQPGVLSGDERYQSTHTVRDGDADGLDIYASTEQSADNLTKVMGEGARFLWISSGLAKGTIGNTSTNLLRTIIGMPPAGRLALDPTFQQLWGSWDSCFGRSYMQTKAAAVAILRPALQAGWVPAGPQAVAGAAPLASGATANGQVTSLLKQDGTVAMTPLAGGASMVSDLGMTWTSNT